MYNRFIGGDVEPYNLGPTKFYVLTEDEVNGMKERIRDQGERIKELEEDGQVWRDAFSDASRQLDASRDAGKLAVEELAVTLAEERAEADLFHAAYVGMCAMHPNRALTIGQSQQEH